MNYKIWKSSYEDCNSYEQVRKLSQLAAEGLKKKQFIFDSIPCDHMGLMQSAEEEVVIGSTVSYCFLHLTLQEYLAALHWSKMDSNCIVRLVSETSLFPLDTLVRNGITKATSHHWPALYFLSGLSKPNQFSDVFNSDPTAAAHDRLDERQFKFGSFIITDFLKFCFGFELSSLFDGIGGRQCNPYFFQLLFESQSRSLTSNLFVNQSVSPMLRRNPLECFVTAWCVTHSNPTTRWNIQFESMSALEEFTRHYEKFVFDSRDCQYGVIAGLKQEVVQSLRTQGTIFTKIGSIVAITIPTYGILGYAFSIRFYCSKPFFYYTQTELTKSARCPYNSLWSRFT